MWEHEIYENINIIKQRPFFIQFSAKNKQVTDMRVVYRCHLPPLIRKVHFDSKSYVGKFKFEEGRGDTFKHSAQVRNMKKHST